MTNLPLDRIVGRILDVYGAWGRETTIDQMRHDWEGMFGAPTAPSEIEPVMANGVEAAWITAPGAASDRVILYFHGGGYQLGSIGSHRDLTARLSAASACRVLAVDYRLAPEHRFPAAVEDALAVYRWLLGRGNGPDSIAFAGDSAGGGLSIATLFSVRTAGLPMPSSVAVMSPWTDMTASGDSYGTRAERDPIHQKEMIQTLARTYIGRGGDPLDPRASPLFGDLSGLPPMLIQVGDRETLLDDAVELAVRVKAAGGDAVLEVEPDMIHVFQLYAAELPAAQKAIDRVGAFLERHFSEPALRKTL